MDKGRARLSISSFPRSLQTLPDPPRVSSAPALTGLVCEGGTEARGASQSSPIAPVTSSQAERKAGGQEKRRLPRQAFPISRPGSLLGRGRAWLAPAHSRLSPGDLLTTPTSWGSSWLSSPHWPGLPSKSRHFDTLSIDRSHSLPADCSRVTPKLGACFGSTFYFGPRRPGSTLGTSWPASALPTPRHCPLSHDTGNAPFIQDSWPPSLNKSPALSLIQFLLPQCLAESPLSLPA